MRKLLMAGSLVTAAVGAASAGEVCGPKIPCSARERYDALVLSYSQKRGLNPRMVRAIIAVESQFTPGAVSPRGARGLMQVMPSTARELGFDAGALHDAELNIAAGTAYLEVLVRGARKAHGLKRGQRLPPWLERRVVAAYHGGPRNLARVEWAESTHVYVRDVFRYFRKA
jgi:soluble lytic murein transglycosylase-like protein